MPGIAETETEHPISYNSAVSFPQAMIDDVKAAFKQRLGDAEWMDEGTKRAALVKLEAITDMIGYPDYIKAGCSIHMNHMAASNWGPFTSDVHKNLPSPQIHATFFLERIACISGNRK